MSAELLRRAAKVLREHAEAASPSPWVHVDYSDPQYQPLTSDGRNATYMGCGSVISDHEDHIGGPICAPDGDLYPRGGYDPRGDMAYIALMHPPVALALADWLDAAAVVLGANYGDEVDLLAEIDDDQTAQHAVIVARAILREQP